MCRFVMFYYCYHHHQPQNVTMPVYDEEDMSEFVRSHLACMSKAKNDLWQGEATLALRMLMEHEHNQGVFNHPVTEDEAPQYFEQISHPQDFGTIRFKLENDQYEDLAGFVADMKLVFSNALTYNQPNDYVYKSAEILSRVFEERLAKLNKVLEEQTKHHCDTCSGRVCPICSLSCLKFTIIDIRCSPPCNARISRKSTYYRLGGDRGQHWCMRCYNALGQEFTGLLGQQLQKSNLEKCSHDQCSMEEWITCSSCSKSMHEICGFDLSKFSSKASSLPFTCPACIAGGSPNDATHRSIRFYIPPRARKIIPPSQAAEFMQEAVHARIEQVLTAKGYKEQDISAIKQSITVCVPSNTIHPGPVEPRMRHFRQLQQQLSQLNVEEMRAPHRGKAICVFQTIDEVDVLLFTMYVQEYGSECPETHVNRGSVYISYLDSVPYIRPRLVRIHVHQEVLLSYFRMVRQRGFKNCYVWACPPNKGDAYVMNSHPVWHRVPAADKLRRWYDNIFRQGKAEGIIVSLSCTKFFGGDSSMKRDASSRFHHHSHHPTMNKDLVEPSFSGLQDLVRWN